MLYGTKMIYRYKEEVPKVDSNGETIIENGDFVTEVKEKKLELCFSANTFIIYIFTFSIITQFLRLYRLGEYPVFALNSLLK